MTTEIKVPTLGESVTEATVGQWFKKAGEPVVADEPLVELETDKVTLEVPAPVSGVLAEILVPEGETVAVGAVIGAISEGSAGEKGESVAAAAGNGRAASSTGGSGGTSGASSVSGASVGGGPASQPAQAAGAGTATPEAEAPQPQAVASAAATPQTATHETTSAAASGAPMPPTPAARKILAESNIDPAAVAGSGRRGQVLKEDALAAAAATAARGGEVGALHPTSTPRPPAAPPLPREARPPSAAEDEAREERVRMSRLRQTIARRLKEAQNTAAMLTTFNDLDMSAVIALRANYRELFEKKYGVKLGFMGLFVKAVVQALKDVPALNAEIDGNDIVFKNYYHIGVAVSTDKGLVVPVVREADKKNLAEIEAEIADLAARARTGKLAIEALQGGTFSITNGGVFGSLLSTPILNVPQSGILGMHRIEKRPVVRKDEIVIRPMMYLALTYDHRLVDGREAVTFLVRLKQMLEDPQRLILEL